MPFGHEKLDVYRAAIEYRSSDSVATRSARSLADIGLVSSIPTPIAVPNESAGDTQAKNLFSLFLHHHLRSAHGSNTLP